MAFKANFSIYGSNLSLTQLNFDNNVSTLCKKAGSLLNAIVRLRKYIGLPEKKTLIEAFVYSNFNYCPLVLHFTSMWSTNKIEPIQKRALRLLYNDYTSTCDSLLAKANKPSMEIKRYGTLALEILNTKQFKSNVHAGHFLFTFLIRKTTK